LLIYKYTKDGLRLWFYLLKDKTEKVLITGNLSQKEAEVLMARNVPTGTTFTLDENPFFPVLAANAFEKTYTFSDKSTAHLIGKTGVGQLTIKTPTMVAFETWQIENNKRIELKKANERADRIESKNTSFEIKTDPTEMPPPPEIYYDRSRPNDYLERLNEAAGKISAETPIGFYQRKLYLAIGSRWNLKIQQTMAQIEKGQIVIKFRVNPDGSISDMDIVKGNQNSFLSVISADSVQQSSGLVGAFPAELLQEKPKGFDWRLSFKNL